MTNQQLINKTAEYIKTKFSGESTGHDWWHMYRVWQLSKTIAAKEKHADKLIVELAALLHDIADWKFHNNDVEAGPREAREWLESLKVDEKVTQSVEDIVRNVSFKGAGVASSMNTLEGKIVHDADKLDALGAVGIARTFAYGGAHDRAIYDPEVKPQLHVSFEAYKNSKSHSINHFYEKLLLLKDRMYTQAGRQIAGHRHKYMEAFLEEFYDEWIGKL